MVPSGSCCINRARTTTRNASVSEKTPPGQAATNSPTLCQTITCGWTPQAINQRRHRRRRKWLAERTQYFEALPNSPNHPEDWYRQTTSHADQSQLKVQVLETLIQGFCEYRFAFMIPCHVHILSPDREHPNAGDISPRCRGTLRPRLADAIDNQFIRLGHEG